MIETNRKTGDEYEFMFVGKDVEAVCVALGARRGDAGTVLASFIF